MSTDPTALAASRQIESADRAAENASAVAASRIQDKNDDDLKALLRSLDADAVRLDVAKEAATHQLESIEAAAKALREQTALHLQGAALRASGMPSPKIPE
jgi:hypothetical protein